MLSEILSAITMDTLRFLKGNDTFFNGDKAARTNAMADLKLPKEIITYLQETTEKDFLNDLRGAARYAKNGNTCPENGLLKAFAQFASGPLAIRLDIMNESAHMDRDAREKLALKALPGDSTVAKTLRNLLSTYSYQEISASILELAQSCLNAPYILVQSPRRMELSLKKEIRAHIQKNHPGAFTIFQVNRRLIGGLRIFKDGTIQDYSWISRVLKFTSLTSA